MREVSSQHVGGQSKACLDWHHFGSGENSVNLVGCGPIIKTVRVKPLILHLVFGAIRDLY